MEKILEAIEKYILYIVLGLYSIFVLSTYTAPYIISKEVLLIVGLSLMVVVWVAKIIVKGTLSFSVGRFDLGVLLVGASYLVSTSFVTPNKMEAYLLPGPTTFVLAGVVLYFVINQFSYKVKNGGIIALFASSIVLAIISLISPLNMLSKIPQLPAFMKDASFNPMGGTIPSIVFLAATLFLSIGLIIKERDIIKKFFFGVGTAVVAFALVSMVISTLPGKPTAPRFMSAQNSWEVAVDTLKKSPFLGVGPANYLTAFNLFRPIEYNQTDLWQVRFTTASNFYFTAVTETGFLGLFAITVLLIAIYKYIKHDFVLSKEPANLANNFNKLAVLAMIILFAILPISPALIVILFALLAILSKSENKTLKLNVAATDSNSLVSSRVPAMIVGLPFIAGVVAVLFFGGKVLAAEATFKESLDALAANDAKTTYDLMSAAVKQNPRVDRYHASFAQVNMALASSLADKKEVTDTDRNTISQLIQQAIAEGKATVSLNPGRSGNWEVLAQIYRSIMPFAQGADEFAIQTYNQAVSLDPANPNLRITLGGVYYSLGRYDNAIDIFKLATIAKPDLANAHYNLAVAYREKKDYTNAIAEVNNVISLVAKDSRDYELAKQTLEDLQAKKSAATPQGSENLTPPPESEPIKITPPIDLPEEATPPAAAN